MRVFRVGDTVAWADVPDGALVRGPAVRHCQREGVSHTYVLKVPGWAFYIKLAWYPEWWPATQERWNPALALTGDNVTIIAMGLTGKESADDLRALAERFEVKRFEVREALRGFELPVSVFTWECRDMLRAEQGLPPDGLFNATRPCGSTLCGSAPDNFTRAEMWHMTRCSECRGALAERLHAAGWRPGDTAERAAELLAKEAQ